jgi:glutathione peroxidase-family protein
LKDTEELKGISSFFDLAANDIFGKSIEFQKFEGQVTVLVNVASECGYTDSHYRGLVKLWKQVKHTEQINILAFPCDQFGHQEPGTSEEINEFAVEEYGVEFTMMEKINVNGPNASVVYKFVKSKAGPTAIQWNFATYFVVSPDGAINSYSGAEPMHLKDTLMDLLQTDEL